MEREYQEMNSKLEAATHAMDIEMNLAGSLQRQITQMEQKLSELKELQKLLAENPNTGRIVELFRNVRGLY